MQISKTAHILDSIESVGNQLKTISDLTQTIALNIQKFTEEVQFVASYLDCNDTESMLFIALFYLTITDGPATLKELASFLRCSPFELIKMDKEVQQLLKRKFIILNDGSRRRREATYVVPNTIVEMVSKGIRPDPIKKDLDIYDLVDKLTVCFTDLRDGNMQYEHFEGEILQYRQLYPNMGIFKILNQYEFSIEENLALIFLFLETADGSDPADMQWFMDRFIPSIRQRMDFKRKLERRVLPILTEGIIEFVEGSFMSEKTVQFTQKANDAIFEDGLFDVKPKTFNPGRCILIEHHKINEKTLYYNEAEQKELDMLEQIIYPARYAQAVERLTAKNLPAGITAVLHGYPGTGKTESVFQLARKTKRNILQVDISQIRDKYVGESEKRLKEIFKVYQKALDFYDQAPILLFNESDALISKRINVSGSVDQMNNTMQNILLQELENFNGVLIATTNLVNNLDTAFERRFLFKVKFSKPGIESKKMIWKSKIECLTDEEASILSQEFELSGGQIDNVSRKLLMNAILSDAMPTLAMIQEYCQNEVFTKKGNKHPVGFKI